MKEIFQAPLFEILSSQCNIEPHRIDIYFVANDGSETAITRNEIYRKALIYAEQFATMGATAGDPVIIALPHTMDTIYAFWGALALGAIPAIFPYALPRPNRSVFIAHLLKIAQNSGARVVLAASEYEDELKETLRKLRCKFLSPESVPIEKDSPSPDATWMQPSSGSQLAYLQYTSGTTGASKGVSLSHTAIFSFITTFGKALKIRKDDVMINWSPLYHDGGLFFGLLMPMYFNIPTVMMSPFKWVRNPGFFLRTIDKYQGTLAWMPNSGFSHTRLRVRERDLENLDLSSMRFILNGSEPILHQTRIDFLERFSGFGFRATALGTGYGLAENTLAVTVSLPDEEVPVKWVSIREMHENKRIVEVEPGVPGSLSLVSSGRIIENTELKIIDDNGRTLPESCIGEIALQGNAVFSGYYNRPELTRATMSNGWLLTGDTGFMASGWLYVCGRKKDIIIVGARNIHPEDIESLAATINELIPDRIAVFGILDDQRGTEKVILVADLHRGITTEQTTEAEQALRQLVYRELDLVLDEMLLFKKGWVVKTANGKMSRNANRMKYLSEMGEKDEHL